MKRINFEKLKIGDRLVRKKGGLFSRHHAIYIGTKENQHYVAENQLGHGVRYITLNKFLTDGKLDRVEYNNLNNEEQTAILKRIDKKIGTKYSVFKYNCEHFANEILTGIAKSKQINMVALAAFGSLLSLAVVKNKRRN